MAPVLGIVAFPFQRLLIQLELLPIIGALAIGLVRFHRLPPALRWLVWLTGFVLLLEGITRWLSLQRQPNLFWMPVYTAGEFLFLALMYQQALESARFTRVMPWLVGGFTAFMLCDSLLAPALARFKPSEQIMESVLVLGLVGLYFRKLLSELRVKQLTREPMFWVSTGLFVYFLAYIQIALFSNFLLAYSLQLNHNIWAVHALCCILLYSCYCLALCLHPPR